MTAARYLIVNADDFGQSPGINRGIIEAHERGIVTSASLMVRWPAAAEAAEHGRRNTGLSVGLHLDLGEWIFRDEAWAPLYEVVPADDAGAVLAETRRQLDEFRRLLGRDPTHLDSHQHVHRSEPAHSALLALGRELGIPVRHFTSGVSYCGAFYGQADQGQPYPQGITVPRLLSILAALPAGTTELGCHPSDGDDLDSMYRSERAEELRTLCDPRVRAALAEIAIELHSFHDCRGCP